MLPDRFYSTIMRLGLDKTASAAASVSCGQGNFKWLAGPPGFQRERAAHQGIEAAVAQDPNGLACPGTGPEAPRALTSVLRSTVGPADRNRDCQRSTPGCRERRRRS